MDSPRAAAHAAGYAALLVDVVSSRAHADRGALQQAIGAASESVNHRVPCLDPLTATVGDELQATYAQPSLAIRAVVELRLELIGTTELRAGIGWGEITVHDPLRTPFGQDGPAWWAAREALDRVAASTPRSGYAARMGIQVVDAEVAAAVGDDVDPRDGGLPPAQPLHLRPEALLQSQLALLDRSLAVLDRTEAQIVLGDLRQEPTDEIASALGLTPSAVSQRRSRNHLRPLVAALQLIDTAL
ncbi:MAG: hypothetical protein ACI9C1_001034 [Candidatus Aldehydirespiratoraceae bacterium]|jgi:hypothetical protein